MDCPNCKLVNPPTATRCDCGYDFQTNTMERSYLTERDKQLSRKGAGVAGAFLIAFFVLRLTSAAVAKHSLVLGMSTIAIAAFFVIFWFRKGKAPLI
jgi:hypothetical protein